MSLFFLGVAFAYPLTALLFLKRNQAKIGKDETFDLMYGEFYSGLYTRKLFACVTYKPFYMLRRLVFCLLTFYVVATPNIMLILFMYLQTLYVTYFGWVRPIEETRDHILEMANETILL